MKKKLKKFTDGSDFLLKVLYTSSLKISMNQNWHEKAIEIVYFKLFFKIYLVSTSQGNKT